MVVLFSHVLRADRLGIRIRPLFFTIVACFIVKLVGLLRLVVIVLVGGIGGFFSPITFIVT